MNVTAIGPLPVGSLAWQRNGNRVLTIVAKATFTLEPGESTLAEQQEPLHGEDAHIEDDPERSVQAPSDMVPFKARADVVLVGHAFAPRAEPVKSLLVRLVVGEIDKSLEVHGDRAWTAEGSLREATRFARLPLRYERAAGGPGSSNPIGIDPDAQPDVYGMLPVPNLQPVGFVPARRGELIPTIGLGPLSASWPGRREKLGRVATRPERWDGAPLPNDLDPAYFNCAPRDQQVDRLRDNERLVLENLHPQHARLVTSLPGLRPRAFMDRGEGPKEIAMAADTLCIDASRGLCTMTWRGYVENPPQSGTVVVALEGPAQALPWAEMQQAVRPAPKKHRPTTMTVVGPTSSPAAELPFGPAAGGALKKPPVTGGMRIPENMGPDGALPFGKQAARIPEPPPSTPALIVPAFVPVPAAQTNPGGAQSPWAGGGSMGPSAVMASPVAAPPPVQRSVPAPAPVPAPVPAPSPVNLPSAPQGFAGLAPSALAASDAAAEPRARSSVGRSTLMSNVREKPARGDVIELLWYDEVRVPRMRAWWEELVTDLDFEDSDPRKDLGADDPDKARGRHNVFGIMTDAPVIDVAGVSSAIAGAVNARGRFTPPLALVAGELRFPFDEVETLKATLVAMTPFAGTDKRLKETIDSITELSATPYLQGSTGIVEKLMREVRDQFRESNRALPAGYLDGHVERLLLEQRRYSIRRVFGGEFIRALLCAPTADGKASADAGLPVYLPKHLDQTLPMLVAMRARVIAEANLQQDPYETSPYALRAIALGRSFQLDGQKPVA